MAATGERASLAEYLAQAGLEVDDVYSGNKSWSDLLEAAGLPTHPAGPSEEVLRRACGRLLHIDDTDRLDTYRHLLAADSPPPHETMTPIA